jgi:RNA polymerase primary sigma factor
MKQIGINSSITSRESESFNKYLKDISKITPFTADEERECAIKASKGDLIAREELVTRNLRFVVTVAKQYVTTNSPLSDLVNEGNLGLIMAAERFSPDNNVKFISYGVWWIKKLIIEHITKYNRMVRLPSNKVSSLAKLERLISEHEQKNGYHVDIDELSQELETDEFEFFDVLTTYRMDSLDKQFGGADGDTSTLLDLLSDDNSFKPTDHLVSDLDNKKTLMTSLDSLREKDKDIIILLFGLDGSEPRTLQEVSEIVDMSREMVRQIKNKTLIKLSKNDAIKIAYNQL